MRMPHPLENGRKLRPGNSGREAILGGYLKSVSNLLKLRHMYRDGKMLFCSGGYIGGDVESHKK